MIPELDVARTKVALGLHEAHYYPDPEQFPDPGEGARGAVVVCSPKGCYDARYTRHEGSFEGRSYYLKLVATSDTRSKA